MVMRSIPELLDDSSSHVFIAVARHLKEGSPPPSSSSDSDADVDELPFIPMPLSMVFSGSRVSLNEIPGDEDVTGQHGFIADGTRKKESIGANNRGGATKCIKDEDITPNEAQTENIKRAPLKKGSSVESDESQTKARRSTMRRGSSADSALLLHIDPEEESTEKESEERNKSLKKAVSMELPNRSPSPGATKLSQEDYALKLELMRQRLLRGGNVDKNMSGLRGPLFETLGIEDERQTGSLDRNLRRSRTGPSTLVRAASSESPGEDTPKTKVFRKSTSFTQGDSEPMPLHRRFGAPLEIPSVGSSSIVGKKLQEATSMSALTEDTKAESASTTAQGRPDQQEKHMSELGEEEGMKEKRTKSQIEGADKEECDYAYPSVITPIIIIEEEEDEEERKENQALHISKQKVKDKEMSQSSEESSFAGQSQTSDKPQSKDPSTIAKTKSADASSSPEHPAVFAKVATPERSPGSVSSSSNPDLPSIPRQLILRTDIKDIDSEELFEARFKKRESSLTRGLKKLTRNKSEEKSPVLSRKANEGAEEIYRPAPRGAPLEMVSSGLKEKSKSVQDLRRDDQETGLGLIGRFSLRAKRSPSTEKKVQKSQEDKQSNVQETAKSKRVSWAVGRSKSLDTKELNGGGTQKNVDDREQGKAEESSVSAMRRKFESKVAGISAKLRTQSEERNNKDTKKELAQGDLHKVTDSPVLAMKQRFENKVAGISAEIRSQSEERKGDSEGKRTPLFTRHRHSQSEGRGLKGMGIPENQLAKQTGASGSKESVESTSSIHSESERRSRWDRWGLTRGKKDKTPSQSDLPSSVPKEEAKSQQFVRSASDFAPVFHIKLKDHVLLEGEPVTLSCLPAGSPQPQITWMKGSFIKYQNNVNSADNSLMLLCILDRKPLEVDDRVNLISHPDGRQLVMIRKSTYKDAGVYECVASNPIATITTSCTLSIACKSLVCSITFHNYLRFSYIFVL